MSLGRTAFTRRIAALSVFAAVAALTIGAGPHRTSAEAQEFAPAVDELAQDQQDGSDEGGDASTTESTVADNDSRLADDLACPAITDPIVRLYNALFNEAPTSSEFLNLASRYQTGSLGLESIAARLIDSERFETSHGRLSDDRFVSLVYRSVLRDNNPNEADRQFWVDSLGAGNSRASMLLSFTESAGFARRTATETPLSGFLRWYPEGTHWYCGVGPRSGLSIKPLDDRTVYADYAFFNGGTERTSIALNTVLGDVPHLAVTSGTLPPGFTSYKWGGLFSGDGNYGNALDINVADKTSWIIVFYPTSIGEQRLGWQIERLP